MNGFRIESQGAETMLVYRLGEGEHLDSFAKGMLQSNDMAGILRPSFIQRDREQYLKFPVTSRIPLNQFIEREMEKETVLKLFLTMSNAIQEVEEYMLSPEKILLDPEYIFVNIRQKEAGLLYLPVDEFTQDITVKEFFLYLLSHMQYVPDGDLSYVARLIHFLNQKKHWTLEELKRQISRLMNERNDPPAPREQVLPAKTGTVNGEITAPAVQSVSGSAYNPGLSAEPEFSGMQSQRAAGIPENEVPPIPEEATRQAKKGGLFSFGKKKQKAPEHEAVPSLGQVPLPVPPSGMAIPGQPVPPSGMAVPGQPVPPSGMAVPGQPVPPAGMAIPGQPVPPSEMKIPDNTKHEKKGGAGRWPFGKNKKGSHESMNSPAMPEFSQNSQEQAAAFQPRRTPASPPYEQAGSNGAVYMDYGSSNEESQTVIMGGGFDYGSTMILGSDQGSGGQVSNHVVKIIRRRTGQSMLMNKDLFRIGSEASFVDLFIGDNPAIGSCHANIYERGGAYYIADQNSVNHTYVNGKMVQPGQMVQLMSGSLITLADEDFDFIVS